MVGGRWGKSGDFDDVDEAVGALVVGGTGGGVAVGGIESVLDGGAGRGCGGLPDDRHRSRRIMLPIQMDIVRQVRCFIALG